MAFDEQMATRVRDALPAGTAEKKMFGALAFLVDERLAVTVGSKDLMVRVGAGAVARAVAQPGVGPCVMGERTMKDWVLVAFSAVPDDEALTAWCARGTAFARDLGEQ